MGCLLLQGERGELHLQARLRRGRLLLQWEPVASADVLPHAHKLPGENHGLLQQLSEGESIPAVPY